MTFFETRKNSNINNRCFNKYIETFNLVQRFNANVENPNYIRIADYQKVTEHFIELFNIHKKRVEKYQLDYYQNKTVEVIAGRIDVKSETLVNYLNKIKYRFKILSKAESENGKEDIYVIEGKNNYLQNDNTGMITLNTKIIQISSFQILKEILEHKMNLLIDNLE